MDDNKSLVTQEQNNDSSSDTLDNYQYYISVRFINNKKSYYFATNDNTLKIDDEVVVETAHGMEIGYISSLPIAISTYHSELELKPIIRTATDTDLRIHDENIIKAKESMTFFNEAIKDLGLEMNPISCEYNLDRSKVIFTYLANDRIDFRDLLKVLAAKLKCRIELRQIGARDKARIVGGIGVCGLPLCCSTFLDEFDGISINRAKNQLLSLNIPKLSGHCGKLICCLKYEDEAYSELRKEFPKIGQRITYNGEQYRISSFNVLTKSIKIEKPDDVQFISLDELNKIMKTNKGYYDETK